MSAINKEKLKHSGRIGQVGIYLGKLFRMFIYQNDWKVMPMCAIIAGLVALVVARNIYKTMEGTLIGTFALSCVCIWNGCFNSIQVICRERPIVKREHRSGLHMSSYVTANLIYQAFLCISQSIITLTVLHFAKVSFPSVSYITGSSMADMFITVFLITYSADVIALFISSVVHSTTTAMTLMPFLLIFQLIFSGGFFSLSPKLLKVSDFTVSKWGLTALCAQGNYNELPMVSLWNALFSMQDYEMSEETKNTIIEAVSEEYDIPENVKQTLIENIPNDAKPIRPIVYNMQGYDMEGHLITDENGNNIGIDHRRDFELECSKNNQKPQYESSFDNITDCWATMIAFVIVFAIMSVISLEFIDRDKR